MLQVKKSAVSPEMHGKAGLLLSPGSDFHKDYGHFQRPLSCKDSIHKTFQIEKNIDLKTIGSIWFPYQTSNHVDLPSTTTVIHELYPRMNLACSRREFPHVFSDLSVTLSLPARQKLGEALARLKLAVQNISHDVGLKNGPN